MEGQISKQGVSVGSTKPEPAIQGLLHMLADTHATVNEIDGLVGEISRKLLGPQLQEAAVSDESSAPREPTLPSCADEARSLRSDVRQIHDDLQRLLERL